MLYTFPVLLLSCYLNGPTGWFRRLPNLEVRIFGLEGGCVAAVTAILWTCHRSINVKSLSVLTVFLCLVPSRVTGTSEIQELFALLYLLLFTWDVV